MIQYFKNAVVDCCINIKIGHQGVSISLSEHLIFHVKNKYHSLHKVRGLMLELTQLFLTFGYSPYLDSHLC